MAAPNYHNYTEVSGSTLEYTSSPVGNYNAAETWTGGETTGTWGAFLISGSAGVNPTATITVAGGAEIEINNFADHKLFEIGVTTISGSAASDAEVYLFKKGRRI
tara:strand:+ start:3837 stop:4151 length:315 start_codon:yes stop_codon:yes gene_type:complete